MRDIVLTIRAAREIRGIQSHLNSSRAGASDDFAGDFFNALRLLANRPELGRKDGREPQHLWSMIKWHKLIVYRFDQIVLTILTIRDTRQEQTP